jgi:hypothetical protein
MFACFDLSSRNPSAYATKVDQLHPDLRREIEAVLEWKTVEYVPGRNAKLAIRPPSERNLRKTLLQVCGFAIHLQGCADLTSLRQVIVPEIICPLIDWLASERKCKKTTITARLGETPVRSIVPWKSADDNAPLAAVLNRHGPTRLLSKSH